MMSYKGKSENSSHPFSPFTVVFQFAGDFFGDGTHHVGFPLSPFTDLLCIHGYHPTLYTVVPLLSGHLLSGHPPLSGQ